MKNTLLFLLLLFAALPSFAVPADTGDLNKARLLVMASEKYKEIAERYKDSVATIQLSFDADPEIPGRIIGGLTVRFPEGPVAHTYPGNNPDREIYIVDIELDKKSVIFMIMPNGW
ncbi:MAG: hypothetical protein EOP49_02270 [Sphingobacteriales bacterium]|nr:MAG: hypothetical protein EOP49_02270 [Sphingobacteriales bacterium]